MSLRKILVTGGAGYIGSHTCVALIDNGFEPVIVDNLCNSHSIVLDRITQITKHRPAFYKADIGDTDALDLILKEHEIGAVIHLAGLKAVGDSVLKPLDYYLNNVQGSSRLFDVLQRSRVRKLIFSSSATVYGASDHVPIPETAPVRPESPYGQTKAMIEQILHDMHRADNSWRIGILRYFNPVGAHESGLIGEDPRGVPKNLMPYLAQVAVGRLPYLPVLGNDYPTPDGTGVRDYIHVMDLADGHLAALNYLSRLDVNHEPLATSHEPRESTQHSGLITVNLGTGRGYSVMEIVRAFEQASRRRIPYRIVGRRPGDTATCYADISRSTILLGWRARRNLEQMCIDAWRRELANHNGHVDELVLGNGG